MDEHAQSMNMTVANDLWCVNPIYQKNTRCLISCHRRSTETN